MTNSQSANPLKAAFNPFEPLCEETRLAYLKAMDIDIWESNESSSEKPLSVERPIEGREPEEPVNSSPQSDDQNNQAIVTEKAEAPASVEDTQIAPPSESLASESSEATKQNLYLKLVDWQKLDTSRDKVKKLLIICRHKVDQPAGAFARATSPSLFMQDIIEALNHLTSRLNINLDIQLGHLATSGISEQSISLSGALETIKPDLLLVLGSEGVKNLWGESGDVSKLRTQLLTTQKNRKAIVSYHPYSLINNPSLKRLMFEDLAFCAQYLSALGN